MADLTLDKMTVRRFSAFFGSYLSADRESAAKVAGLPSAEYEKILSRSAEEGDFYMTVPKAFAKVCEVISVAVAIIYSLEQQNPGIPANQFIGFIEETAGVPVGAKLMTGDIQTMQSAVVDMGLAFGVDVGF